MRTLDATFALTKACAAAFDEGQPTEPVELFHYTDTSGLVGILGSKGELWATDVRCMNDTDELTLGTSLLTEALEDSRGYRAYSLLRRLLQHQSYVSGHIFTISFSAHPDVLSQWRAYAGNGSGFSVGFDTQELKQLTLNGAPVPVNLIRIEYDKTKQQDRARRLVESALRCLEHVAESSLDEQGEQLLVTGLGLVLPIFAASCKNGAFSEEAEYRVVARSHQDPILPPGQQPQLTTPTCLFRDGRYGITPYIKLRVRDGQLTQAFSRIIVGPCAPKPQTTDNLRVLVANAGIKDWSKFPIEHSKASYRQS